MINQYTVLNALNEILFKFLKLINLETEYQELGFAFSNFATLKNSFFFLAYCFSLVMKMFFLN